MRRKFARFVLIALLLPACGRTLESMVPPENKQFVRQGIYDDGISTVILRSNQSEGEMKETALLGLKQEWEKRNPDKRILSLSTFGYSLLLQYECRDPLTR